MATPNGRESATLADQLLGEAYRFDFFQAVRLLERMFLDKAGSDSSQRRYPVGQDQEPAREVVRFRAMQSLSFPASSVVELRRRSRKGREGDSGSYPLEMLVSFMGLTGANGVLPDHYTRLLIERIREKDYSLVDFLDLFNHRLTSLFFRAWEKYRFPTAYERSRLDPSGGGEDFFTSCLFCLVGLGTGGLRGRMRVDDEAFLLYAGFFADTHRPAVSLERMLSDYFDLQARVHEFQGRWLPLSGADRSALPSLGSPGGLNSQLGVNVVLGERVWDLQSKFRLRLGPLTYGQYCRFLPSGDALEPLFQLVRAYVGPEFDFEVQPVLQAAEIPPCRLDSSGGAGPRLGWTTWLLSVAAQKDFEDAGFLLDEV